ncbi:MULTISPECIES: ABC transporter ATP-binding protein [Achromobacter]|uniref:Nitrate ABC transporter ATP-binding protein n=1 Tax=Achromobacter spanius TaxID=217203 RepID=A0AAW3I7Y2_9BURK|nr:MULTISPECIES: ABC transporter ATP-binding protein [Achromobacter]KNE28749.1 nitrate ABC transporter ATP-binding protein [Achromobacter spanius]MCD0500200.1 ABC transporter ATP-binding protein [Achromobacter sp. MY14]
MMADPARPFLHIEGAVYTYPGRAPIVNGIDWRLQAGGFHCLVGRSGCGKTTLLKLAAGLITPQSGRVVLQDGTPAAPGPQLGYVFQAPTLLEWQRVIDNVLLPVSLQRRPLPEDLERAHGLLAMLGLSDHAQHYPRQLSGGQQSRVALARALILEPALLLLDEPFAALDAITRGELQDDLLRMCRLRNTTVLFVTHDISEAVYLGDRVAVMHQGRMLADLPVNLPAPRTQAMRHGAAFNAACAQVFEFMNGARP